MKSLPEALEISKKATDYLRFMLENPDMNESVSNQKSACNAVCEISEHLKNVFSISTEKVFFVSYPSGNIVYMNPLLEERIRIEGLDPSNKKITDIFSIMGPEGVVPSDDMTKLNVFIYNQGCYEQVELTATDISCGEFSLLLVYTKNISAIKKSLRAIYESEIQHRTTIDAIRDGVVVVDKNLNIVIYNRSFIDIASQNGQTEPVAGKKLVDVAPFLPGKLGLEYKYVFKSGETLDTIIKIIRDGVLRYYEVIKTPVFDNNEVIRIVTILRDRTHNYHLEQLKKEAFFQIEKNMEQFAILNDHIRNPLQAIVGLADLDGSELCSKIISQANEINDIVTKLDTGWIESEKVRDMLLKHYGITVKRRPSVDSPIGMLKTDEIY